MIDEQWIKNLASAQLDKNNNTLKSNSDISESIIEKIDGTLQELYQLTVDSIKVFNYHAPTQRTIKVFLNDSEKSFSLLLSNIQAFVSLENKNIAIKVKSTTLFNNQQISYKIFTPFIDNFGSLLWKSDHDNILWDCSLVVKNTLETLLLTHQKQNCGE